MPDGNRSIFANRVYITLSTFAFPSGRVAEPQGQTERAITARQCMMRNDCDSLVGRPDLWPPCRLAALCQTSMVPSGGVRSHRPTAQNENALQKRTVGLTADPDTCTRPMPQSRRRRRRWSAGGRACCGSRLPRRRPAFLSGTARPNQSSRTRSARPAP